MKVFYKNLNSLRFIAASLVIIHHIEQYKGFDGLPNVFFPADDHPSIFLFGKLGVNIFFVLSGFLITSLLVIEKDRFQRISIGKFYMRRILRIWPLYFLIVILGFFVWPHVPAFNIPQMPSVYLHFWPSILLTILFLPNLQMLLFRSIAYEAQIWSVGVEEQFYLVWPFITNLTKNKEQFKKVIIWLLSIYVGIKVVFYLIPLITHRFMILDDLVFYLSYIFQVDCMMIGALFAMFNFDPRAKAIITKVPVQIAAYVLVITFAALGLKFAYFYWEIYGVLFGIIIFNLVNTETTILNLDFKWLDYLGRTSYGMYMLHPIFIMLILRFITTNSIWLYVLTYAFTLIASTISYEYFEKPFLRWKNGYAKVQSGAPTS